MTDPSSRPAGAVARAAPRSPRRRRIWALLRTLLWTDVPESLGPEDYRRTFRVLVFVCPLLAAMNVANRWMAGGTVEVYDRFLALNLPAHALIVLVALLVAPRLKGGRSLRALAVLVIFLLLWTAYVGRWLIDTLLTVFLASLVIAGTRAQLDAPLSLVALVMSIAM